MTFKGVVVLAFAVGFFLSAVVLVFSLLSGESPYARIVLNVVELRNVGDDAVGLARLVSSTDRLVAGAGDDVKVYWSRVTECLSGGCGDDVFFDLIVAVVLEGDDEVPHADLVAELVAVNRFWGSGEVVEFSKALASADELISGLGSKALDKGWKAVIACDGVCAEKNDLFFDLIRLVVVQKEV